jgi:hypothetical protein
VTDPYAPFPVTPARAPSFPRERLLRSGLDEDTVGRLESEFDTLDAAGRVEFGRYVTAHSDDVIRDRFAEGVTGVEQPEPVERSATPTYEELNAETIDELDDRLREWNDAHPEQHLTIAGRKGEKIGRLLDAYEQEANAPEQTVQVSEPVAAAIAGTEQPTGGTTTAEQQLPTAPTATTPEGAPQAAPAAPVAPAGTVEAGNASTGAQQPAQTADAAGAGPTA